MDDLIYDRTLEDVKTALSNVDSSVNLKGSYNYTDLNRVENWCKYIEEILMKYGFSQNLEIKTNWSLTDYPTRKEVDRIRQNIESLKEFCYAIQTEVITYNNTLNYEQANIIEKILYDIYEYIKSQSKKLNIQYNFGFTLIREKFIDLIVNTDTIDYSYKKQLTTENNIFVITEDEKFLRTEWGD